MGHAPPPGEGRRPRVIGRPAAPQRVPAESPCAAECSMPPSRRRATTSGHRSDRGPPGEQENPSQGEEGPPAPGIGPPATPQWVPTKFPCPPALGHRADLVIRAETYIRGLGRRGRCTPGPVGLGRGKCAAGCGWPPSRRRAPESTTSGRGSARHPPVGPGRVPLCSRMRHAPPSRRRASTSGHRSARRPPTRSRSNRPGPPCPGRSEGGRGRPSGDRLRTSSPCPRTYPWPPWRADIRLTW